MRLSTFIRDHMESILQEWEDFAKTLHPLSKGTNRRELRDHAESMLRVICADLDTRQDSQESIDKSQGLAADMVEDTAAEIHAADRMSSGFTIEELMAEYRALRASVLRLWEQKCQVASAVDIQDMVRFNEAIDQSLTESVARYSSMMRESQSVFLAILGHDVRTPLGAISMGAQILQMDSSLAPASGKVASRILSSCKRVEEIVRDLLDFATSHLGDGIPISVAPMAFGSACENVVEELRAFHPERKILLDMAGDLMVEWDGARMCQALSNLIANAVQHGSPVDPVWVTVKGGEQVVWTIRNRGETMSPKKLRSIFDPAQRFAMRPASERGHEANANLGLGLYITRQIIGAHGGKIGISSTDVAGTTFIVTLPRVATA